MRAFFRDERGFTVVDAVVGTIVSAVLLALISSAMISFLTAQSGIVAASGRTSAVAIADIAWRRDVQSAVSTQNPSTTHVEFVAPEAGDDECRLATWTVVPSGSAFTVTVTNQMYSSLVGTQCAGSAGASSTRTVITDAGSDAAFSYTNLGGRQLSFVDSLPVLGNGAQPATVTDSAWASELVGTATLTASVYASSTDSVSVRLVQFTSSLLRLSPPAIVPSELVSS